MVGRVSLVEAAFLGLIQGLTEFLPISSTAHLRVVPALAGWADPGAAFTAVLQLGTLVAVVGFFAPDLSQMLRGALSPTRKENADARRLVHICLGTFPIGVTGLLLKDEIEGPWRAIPVVAVSLVGVALLMALTERLKGHSQSNARGFDTAGLRDALIIGSAQTLALVPGVSRSGITLIAAMAIGFRRDAAARYSFLLGLPAIAAAGLFELPKVIRAQNISAAALLLGLVVSAVSGYATIAWLLRFLRTKTTKPFVLYRIGLGVLLLALAAAGAVH